MANFSDEDLISRVLANGDRNAFGELVRRYQSQVRALLRKLTCGDEHMADDLAQDTFIKAYKSLAGFQGNAKFSTWLYRIAYNMFISSKRRSPTLGTEEFVEEAGEAITESTADRLLMRFDLEKSMAYLSEAERGVLALCYGKGYTHEEAAEVLGCPLGTVKTNALRGKVKLRERIMALEKEAV